MFGNGSVALTVPLVRQPRYPRPTSRISANIAGERCEIGVASTRKEREAAYAFVYRAYREEGFTGRGGGGLWYSLHHILPATATFIMCRNGEIVATATAVPDSPLGLPMERMYREEIDGLRRQGRRPCEIAGLAVRGASFSTRLQAILHMYRVVYYYAKFYLTAHDFTVVVSPEHARFYRRVLLFDEIGGERSDPNANGAASVAIRLDLVTAPERFRRRQAGPRPAYNMYDFFVRLDETWRKL